MSDDQARGMRPETTSEHIARDMREGRFPEQSERQMVAVLASPPGEIQVWCSTDTLDHIGNWATTRYPAEAVTYVRKTDAQVAVALVIERAAQQCEFRDHSEGEEETEFDRGYDQACDECATIVRALAPADGLEAIQALRKELDETQTQLGDWIVRADEANVKAEKAEAERDHYRYSLQAMHRRAQRSEGRAQRTECLLASVAGYLSKHSKDKTLPSIWHLSQYVLAAREHARAAKGRAFTVHFNFYHDREKALQADRDRLAAELAAAQQREAVGADLLLNAYKAMLVLHRICEKSGLTAGADAANNIANQIVAAHPEMPVRASLRAALSHNGRGE